MEACDITCIDTQANISGGRDIYAIHVLTLREGCLNKEGIVPKGSPLTRMRRIILNTLKGSYASQVVDTEAFCKIWSVNCVFSWMV